jgi:hypothetical protein
MTIDVDAIRATCGRATPGPWEIQDDWFGNDEEKGNPTLPVAIIGAGDVPVIQFDEATPFWNEDQPDGATAWANAALIVGCRTLIPALCDALDAERERTRVLTDLLRDARIHLAIRWHGNTADG